MKKYGIYSLIIFITMAITIQILLSSCSELVITTNNEGRTEYFPLIPGASWTFEGSSQLIAGGKIEVPFANIDTTYHIDTTMNISLVRKALPEENIELTGKFYRVIPVEENVDDLKAIKYFEKSPSIIYLRGIKTANAPIKEMEEPTYLKMPLTIGNKWDCTIDLDLVELLKEYLAQIAPSLVPLIGEPEYTVNESKMQVMGREQKLFQGKMVEILRLDQNTTTKGTIDLNLSGISTPINFTCTIATTYHLLKKVGFISKQHTINSTIEAKSIIFTLQTEQSETRNLALRDFTIPEFEEQAR